MFPGYNPSFFGANDHYFQQESVEDEFFVSNARQVSNTSIYLDEELSAYLDERLKVVHLSTYLLQLMMKYRSILPVYLPKNRKVKKIIQPRVGNRKRYCFRPYGRDFWDLKLIATAADVSIGYVVALMIWFEMIGFGKVYAEMRQPVVISHIRSQCINEFTIIYNPFTNLVKKKFRYQRGHFKI